MKYIVDGDGVYLGAFQGLGPEGGIEVEIPPEDGRQLWDGEAWGSIPVDVPQSVSRFQAQAAIYNAGLWAQVEAIMQAPDTDMLAKLAWGSAQEFRRTSPLVTELASQLGLTEEQLDDLFIAAAQIEG